MSHRLLVERHRCRYRVHRSHPDPAAVRLRLDGVVADRVPAQLGVALEGLLPDGDGVIVIRRLAVRLVLGATLPEPDAASQLWTRGLASAIGRAVAGGDVEVVRFASRAAHLAAFWEALVRGDAWSSWPFESLRRWEPLGSGGAAVAAATAIRAADVCDALAALASAPGDRLAAFVALLSEREAEQLAEQAGVSAPGRGGVLVSLRAEEVAPRLVAGRRFAGSPSQLAVWLTAHLGAARPTLAHDELAVVAELARLGPSLLAHGVLGGAARDQLRAEVPERRALLATLDALVPGLAAALEHPVSGAVGEPGDHDATPFGGCLLLLPTLADLALDDRLGEAAAGRVRRLAMIAALGEDHGLRARFDPVLHRLAGDPGGAWDGVVDEGLVAEVAARARREVGLRLPGFTESSAEYLVRNVLVGAAKVRFGPASTEATLPDVPLRVALQLAGWEDRFVVAPWLPGGGVQLVRELEP